MGTSTPALPIKGGDISAHSDSGRRWTIGFLAPVIHSYFYGSLFSGLLNRAVARGGRAIAIQTADAGNQVSPDVELFTSQVAWQHLDALVVAQSTVTDSYVQEFARSGKPVVATYRVFDEFKCPTVVPDNGDGIRAAVDHLIEHGHERIAFVSRDPANADDWIRYRAYEHTMRARGLEPGEPVMMPWYLGEVYDGKKAVQQLVERGPLPTAVVACTDVTAIALIPALAEIGITVPGDMAVIGFDDIAEAATCAPPLSTIAQSFTLAGSTACDLVFDALEGHPAEPGLHCTPVTFVSRESCGCSSRSSEGTIVAPAGTEGTRNEFAGALAEALYGECELTGAQSRAVSAIAERVVALLAVAEDPADTEVVGFAEATGDAFQQLVARSPNLLRVVGALRRFADRIAGELASHDGAAAARAQRLASDLAMRLLEKHRCDLSSQATVHQDVESQRRYYMISTDLVRRRAWDSSSLPWLEHTEVRAACFAQWEGGRGNTDNDGAVRITGVHDKSGRFAQSDPRCPVRAFPPAQFVDLLDAHPGDLMYLLPVRFDGSDWGYLALTGPFDPFEESSFERYNHWAVQLTVALDHEQAMNSERTLLEEIRISEERYALAAEAANDGLWDWNLTTGVMYYSARWKTLLGYSGDEISARPDEWLDRIHPDDRCTVDEVLSRLRGGDTATMELEYRLRACDHSYRWMLTHGRSMHDESGQVIRLVGSMTDISDRKYLEDRLRRDAHYDALTGLPNRKLFLERLNMAIERAKRSPDYIFAVVFLDLNGFKLINDSLGHEAGDEVLIQVAARLTGQLRATDTVARLGGDEFVLLLDDIRDLAGLPIAVNRTVAALSAPLHLGDRTVAVGAAAGIAVSTDGYRNAEELVREADIAMYQSKSSDDGSPVLFDESMDAGAMTRLQLESDLHKAIDDDRFELYYQPILRMPERSPVGFEALLRWHHPTRGTVLPEEFLPIAENSALIRTIGRWTIRSACRQFRAWLDVHPDCDECFVSINVSNRQLCDPEFRGYVHGALADFGIPHHRLVLEVNEGAITHNQETTASLLHRLHDDGIRLHIDDFGTGSSSLAALHNFPIDALKINRSFVARVGSDPRSRELVRAMFTMGQTLGIDVIAEGVETDEEASTLTELGCRLAQGFLFSHPLPATGTTMLSPTATPAPPSDELAWPAAA